jgi:hypothetical protein
MKTVKIERSPKHDRILSYIQNLEEEGSYIIRLNTGSSYISEMCYHLSVLKAVSFEYNELGYEILGLFKKVQI